jgi:4-hydroxy-3-methylbut-2-enyl diphosphate reductase
MQSEEAMQILRADALGLCFGVRDALARALAVDSPGTVTIHGELVHNDIVQRQLAARGFAAVGEQERAASIPATPRVLVTAHGISDAERARLQAAGKELIDTTCPLVRKVHVAAQRLAADGYHVVVIGRPDHVEVRGIVEDLPSCDVLRARHEVRPLPHDRIGVVCQTTVPILEARLIAQELRRQNPQADVRFVDTVCEPTKQRIAAVEALAARVEAIVVVGGHHSNNTRQLAMRCARLGVRVLHVASADELDPAFFAGIRSVGLTAGTSTLDATIDEVHEALRRIAAAGPAGAQSSSPASTPASRTA